MTPDSKKTGLKFDSQKLFQFLFSKFLYSKFKSVNKSYLPGYEGKYWYKGQNKHLLKKKIIELVKLNKKKWFSRSTKNLAIFQQCIDLRQCGKMRNDQPNFGDLGKMRGGMFQQKNTKNMTEKLCGRNLWL